MSTYVEKLAVERGKILDYIQLCVDKETGGDSPAGMALLSIKVIMINYQKSEYSDDDK